jgi:hypothetical protein
MKTSTRARWIVVAIVVAAFAVIGAFSGSGEGDPTVDVGAPSTDAELTTPWTTPPEASTDAPFETSTTPAVPTTPAPTTPPSTTPAPATGPVATTRWILGGIPIKGRAPKTGYSRAEFGPSWTDDVPVAGGHNGCDTRNDILRRDLQVTRIEPGTHGCVVLTGILHDPYTGARIDFTRGRRTSSAVQIDHVVALNDAWQKGAQQIGAERRRMLANDPLNLLAVDGPANNQKGAGDAATWLPHNKGFRCRYVALQTQVKGRYRLWMTRAEHDAIARILAGCTDAQVGEIG